MLVLQRRPDDAIVFPKLGITVRILRLSRQVARVGIEAPPHIRVMRQELDDGTSQDTLDAESFEQNIGGLGADLHRIRNRLNTLNLGLQLYRHQIDAGQVEQANATFLRVIEQLEKIEREVGEKAAKVDAVTTPDHRPTASASCLLVEDEREQRDMLANLLEMRGCTVDTAESGQEALDRLASGDLPDLVLLDMRLGDIDGVEVIRRLRSNAETENLRIIAISGLSSAEVESVQPIESVEQWLPKPLNMDLLVEFINTGSQTASTAV